ncbi:unnamed protein product [Angiostrongylus costaricensis]|uniref:PH domain-containing protein n=1 Tax=Angiostrongylus costaricensis TaxID=334426 RepID=A0A158PJI1_ANGCS|nr:unnamed protein product [Angiostrongylus costaricensis]
MKERVDLNSNGLCIESRARVLKNGKWVKRYILCKKPSDVSSPILYVYKSKKDRKCNNSKVSLVLQNYVGFESGFELNKCTHTLALLTMEDIVVISFLLPESLILWETWLKSTCGTNVQDSRLAIVYGRPAKLLLYCDIHFTVINVNANNLITIQQSQSTSNDSFVFMCARSETFQRMLSKATTEKGLHRYLSKKNSEGDWMPDFVVSKQNEQLDTESQFSQAFSGLFNFFNMEQSMQTKKLNLDKEKSKSGELEHNFNTHSLNKAFSVAFYHNAKPSGARDEASANYVNISKHSVSRLILDRDQGGSERERLYAPSRKTSRFENSIAGYENYQNQDSILQNRMGSSIHRKSLPNYINAYQSSPGKRSNEENRLLTRSPNHGYRRKSELALAHAMDKPSTSKGRSVGDLKTARLEESRYENWRKAKKFISSFKPKSQSDLNHRNKMNRHSLVKSSSTGALQFATSARYVGNNHLFLYSLLKWLALLEEYNNEEESLDSFTDFDEPPPSLDQVVCKPTIMQKEESPPEGLVRPKEDIQIRPRAGVSAVLARRLAASVTGSFSKYDGERGATHHYQGGPINEPLEAASPPMLEALDGIEAAVYRGQDRLKESDRRASNVSFHKQASTSGESLESEQTAKTNSPSSTKSFSRVDASVQSLESITTSRQVDYSKVSLPAAANSTSSSNSVNSRVEYVTIDPVSTTAAREVALKLKFIVMDGSDWRVYM